MHMLPNWQLGVLGDAANLHFNVNLFLPHNCLYKKIVKHPSLYIFERHNHGWRDEFQWSWKRVNTATEVKVRHRMWYSNKLGACVNIFIYLNFSCFKSHLSQVLWCKSYKLCSSVCQNLFWFLFLSMDLNICCSSLRHINYLITEDGCKMWGSITESKIAALKIYASFLPHQPMFSRVELLQVLYKGETCNFVLPWARKRKFTAFCFLENWEI